MRGLGPQSEGECGRAAAKSGHLFYCRDGLRLELDYRIKGARFDANQGLEPQISYSTELDEQHLFGAI